MPERLTKKQRVLDTLKGREVDRPPVSMWRHFFEKEDTVEGLAEAMLSHQRRHEWDFMKVNPRASYHAEDWGVKVKYSGDPNKAPETVDWPVKKLSDWDKIKPLNVNRGVLGEHLEALKIIAKGLKGEVPFLMTVFSPLSIAGRLPGSDQNMLSYLRENPQKVHDVLEVVTETFTDFSQECIRLGASGLFFATTTWGTYDRLTEREYDEFGRTYDLKLLKALPKTEFNLLHVCRRNNMLRFLADYPVDAFNWDAQDPSNASLKEGRDITGKTVVGGISHTTTLVEGKPQEVTAEVERAKKDLGRMGWMLGPGCTYPPRAPEQNIEALRKAIAN